MTLVVSIPIGIDLEPEISNLRSSNEAMKVVELLEQRRQNWNELERLCDQMEKRSKRRWGRSRSSASPTSTAPPAPTWRWQMPISFPSTRSPICTSSWGGPITSFIAIAEVQFPRLGSRDDLRAAAAAVPRQQPAAGLRALLGRVPGLDGAGLLLAGLRARSWWARRWSPSSRTCTPSPSRGAAIAARPWPWAITRSTTRRSACNALPAACCWAIGGLFELTFNAGFLGAAFGHMARAPQRANFYEFVTAHGPFELTAIVLSAAAGMRLGFSLVETRGLSRGASLRQAGQEAKTTISAAIILFALAAVIEGFLSPSAAPYWVKASVGRGLQRPVDVLLRVPGHAAQHRCAVGPASRAGPGLQALNPV